jgi:hypothetical protein
MKQTQRKSKMAKSEPFTNIEGGDIVRDKVEAIVRQVIKAYLEKQMTSENKLLILLDYETPKKQEVWDTIKDIASNYRVVLCVSDLWNELPSDLQVEKVVQLNDLSHQTINELIESVDALLVPSLSYSFIAKLAMTIDDEPTLQLSIQMQMAGKKLLLAKDGIVRKGAQKLVVPHTIQERVNRYISQLIKDGVNVYKLNEFKKWLNSNSEALNTKKPIVLAKHIEEMAEEGDKELVISKETLISPLGKDMARELGISLKVKE